MGQDEVFGHDDPQASLIGSVTALRPQLLVPTLLTVGFLCLSRLPASRREAA